MWLWSLQQGNSSVGGGIDNVTKHSGKAAKPTEFSGQRILSNHYEQLLMQFKPRMMKEFEIFSSTDILA